MYDPANVQEARQVPCRGPSDTTLHSQVHHRTVKYPPLHDDTLNMPQSPLSVSQLYIPDRSNRVCTQKHGLGQHQCTYRVSHDTYIGPSGYATPMRNSDTVLHSLTIPKELWAHREEAFTCQLSERYQPRAPTMPTLLSCTHTHVRL